MDKYTQAQGAFLHAKAVVADQVSQLQGPCNAFAARTVENVEKVVPTITGMLPKTAEDLALVSIYFLVVFYICLKIALFAITFALKIFCCICCCGCCWGGQR